MTQELSDEGLKAKAKEIVDGDFCFEKIEEQLVERIHAALKQVRRETARPLVEALERIISGVPVCVDGSCYVEHTDEDGNYAGTEPVDPIAVISSVVGCAHQALTAHRALEGR